MFNIILISFFITRYVYANSNQLNEITASRGGIAYKSDGSTIYFKQNEAIKEDFSGADAQTYKVEMKILRE